jgi:hypothetical protein
MAIKIKNIETKEIDNARPINIKNICLYYVLEENDGKRATTSPSGVLKTIATKWANPYRVVRGSLRVAVRGDDGESIAVLDTVGNVKFLDYDPIRGTNRQDDRVGRVRAFKAADVENFTYKNNAKIAERILTKFVRNVKAKETITFKELTVLASELILRQEKLTAKAVANANKGAANSVAMKPAAAPATPTIPVATAPIAIAPVTPAAPATAPKIGTTTITPAVQERIDQERAARERQEKILAGIPPYVTYTRKTTVIPHKNDFLYTTKKVGTLAIIKNKIARMFETR